MPEATKFFAGVNDPPAGCTVTPTPTALATSPV